MSKHTTNMIIYGIGTAMAIIGYFIATDRRYCTGYDDGWDKMLEAIELCGGKIIDEDGNEVSIEDLKSEKM